MPEPVGSDMHIDTFLSNISIGYMNAPGAYVADQVFPVVPTAKQSDKYAKYNKHDWFRDDAQQRAPLTESSGGGFKLDDPGTFFCNETAFHKDYADEDIDNADEVFAVDDDCTAYVTEKLRLSRERKWASNFFATGKWTTDLEGMTDTPESGEFLVFDDSSSDPVGVISNAKITMQLLTGVKPNTLVVSDRVHSALKQHSDVIDRYKYTQAGIMTEALLAKVFEIDRYFISSAVYSSSPQGSETIAYALDQYGMLLLYVNPRPSKRTPSAGYTFRWSRPISRGVSGDRLESTIRKFRLTKERGTRIEGGVYEDMKLVAADCGVFFNNAVANGRTITS